MLSREKQEELKTWKMKTDIGRLYLFYPTFLYFYYYSMRNFKGTGTISKAILIPVLGYFLHNKVKSEHDKILIKKSRDILRGKIDGYRRYHETGDILALGDQFEVYELPERLDTEE